MQVSKLFYTFFYKKILGYYLRFNVQMKHDNFKIIVYSGIFHPGFFFSTKYLYSFLQKIDLTNKRFLEIGCGSGILSLLAFRKKAIVTAIDINPKAVENTIVNFKNNFKGIQNIQIIESDLFEKIPSQIFDFIIINPPYFFNSPQSLQQQAWYCGKNGEYFTALFKHIKKYISAQTEIFMILADNCEIERIEAIAHQNEICFILVEEKKIKWETNYIYKLIVK